MNPIKFCGKLLFEKSLQRGSVSTFKRVCTSNHLEDLQSIAFFTLTFSVLFVAVILKWPNFFEKHQLQELSCAGVIATAAAILNWVYQTGSSRLGVIDLFGCEISAICRVCSVVDFAQSCVNSIKALDTLQNGTAASIPKKTSPFTSEENYTPVYDGRLSDLQPLDANVLNSVTEFYTYRKTMMDCLRHLAALPLDSPFRRQSSVQMIYMQFLMFESGHKAVDELIEFEPNRTESLINILCSELVLYRFLLEEYGKRMDCRYDRLKLRKNDLEKFVDKIYSLATEPHDDPNRHWDRAKTSAGELKSRFEKAFEPEAHSDVDDVSCSSEKATLVA